MTHLFQNNFNKIDLLNKKIPNVFWKFKILELLVRFGAVLEPKTSTPTQI